MGLKCGNPHRRAEVGGREMMAVIRPSFFVKSTERERFLVLLDGVVDAMREEPSFIESTSMSTRLSKIISFCAKHGQTMMRSFRTSLGKPIALPSMLRYPRCWKGSGSDERGCPPRKLKGLSG